MLNALSFDVEEWYHRNDFDVSSGNVNLSRFRVVSNTEKLLDFLSKNGLKATFFILGCIAEKHPKIIRKISALGHEIASHGYSHTLVYKQTKNEFKKDLKNSILVLEDVSGKKVLGFRAPSWSLTKDSCWALDIICDLGLRYDSSIFPIRTFLYGIPDAPRFIHKIYNNLLEFPPSVIRTFGRNIPFAGGVFFRLSPLALIKFGVSQINRLKEPVLISLHSWDIDNFRPKLNIPLKGKLRYYLEFANLTTTEKKLKILINDFKFGTVKEVLNSKLKEFL